MTDRESFLNTVGAALPFDAEERDDIVEELRAHISDAAADLQGQGLSPEAAQRSAIDRMGPPDRLARDLTSARRSSRRLLSAVGAGSWALVTGGTYGWIVGLILATLAWLASVSVIHFVGAFAFDSVSFIAIGVALYSAGSALVPVVAERAGYRARLVRRVLAVGGALSIGAYALFGWSGPLDVVGVVVILSTPIWWVAGTWRQSKVRRGSMRTFGGLLIVAALLTVATQVAQMQLRDRWDGYSEPGDLGLSRIAAPVPEAIKAVITGSAHGSGSGDVGMVVGVYSLDISSASAFDGWVDLRIEAWRALDAGPLSPTPLSPGAVAPFTIAPAVWSPAGQLPDGDMTWWTDNAWGPDARTLSGNIRLDRTSGITAAWVAITGIGRDGVRYLIDEPDYVEATFDGTVLQWIQASLGGAPAR